MSKYTTELRYICEHEAGLTESVGYSKIDEVLTASMHKVFDFPFPIFDENYRSVLERKILRHYYTREICAETVGLWKHYLNMRMNEIMPYYNKLYESELLEFNPFFDTDITIDHTLENNKDGSESTTDAMTGTVGDSGQHTNSINDNTVKSATDTVGTTDVYSDTPQGALTGVLSGNYLTNARKTDTTDELHDTTTFARTDSGTASNTRTYNTTNTGRRTNELDTTEQYLEHIKGKRGGLSFSKLLGEYRDTLLNIDMMIINDLKDLFFGLW